MFANPLPRYYKDGNKYLSGSKQVSKREQIKLKALLARMYVDTFHKDLSQNGFKF